MKKKPFKFYKETPCISCPMKQLHALHIFDTFIANLSKFKLPGCKKE